MRWLEAIFPFGRRRTVHEMAGQETSRESGSQPPNPGQAAPPDLPTETGPAPRVAWEVRSTGGGRLRPIEEQVWESVAERMIREAQERGEFDNLPGTGKPLNLDTNPYAGDWELGFHLLKQAGYTLPWIELGREIEADTQALRGLLQRYAGQLGAMRAGAKTALERRQYEDERGRLRARYLEAAAELDRKLGQYSAEVPTWRMDKGRLPKHVAARQFDDACPPL